MVDIEELKRLDREATQGEWKFHGGWGITLTLNEPIPTTGARSIAEFSGTWLTHEESVANAKLTAHIKNNLPAIIAELESLRSRVAQKPDAKRLAEAIVHETPWGQLSWSECVNYAKYIIERDMGE